MKSKKVHVVSHSHWDREWYFTSARSTVYLINHIKTILEFLEKNVDFKYYLMDAQSSLVEDYLEFAPEDRSRLKDLITKKRFFVGPWYAQTDQLVVSQESVVRNLLYGIQIADEMGHSMKVAYAPDIFGQAANAPQIYSQFGMNRFLFWRGVSNTKSYKTDFVWEGSDGSKMLAVEMPFGYHFGGNIPENEEEMKEYIHKFIDILDDKSATKNIYFPNGFDQAPLRTNLLDVIEMFNKVDEKREYVLSNPELFFDELEYDDLNNNNENLKVLKGELTEGAKSRIHKSIFSTRADLKQMNNKTENFIVNILEPILCISHSLGNRYPQKELDKIWKLMFQNSAHDSIGACNSDTTNKDVYFRYKTALDYAENLLELNMRLISVKAPQKEHYTFNIFNTLPYKRSGVTKIKAYIPKENFVIYDDKNNELDYTILSKIDQTEYVLNQQISLNPSKKIFMPSKVYLAELLIDIKEVPALGYNQIYFRFVDETVDNKSLKNTSIIENEHYIVQLEKNNTLTITDKQSGKIYKNQMELEENGDDGDSYNYSPPRKDMIISSKEAILENIETSNNLVEEKINASFKLNIPQSLKDRANGIKNAELKYNTTISLRKDEKLIRFNFSFDNQAYSHRVCIVFDTEIKSSLSTADQLFGTIQRPVRLEEMDIWEKENWSETPISIEAMQSYVTLHNDKTGCAVITDGVREYEIIGEEYNKIRLTLFRTFEFMGKENLLYRPGRASGESIIRTKDAQLIGKINCELALHTYNSNFDSANIAKIAKEYLTPLTAYQISDFLNGRLRFAWEDIEKTLNSRYSLTNFEENTDAVMSCLKKSQYNDNYIIRFFNPYLDKDASIDQTKIIDAVKLDEKSFEAIKENLKHCEFQTYILKI